MNWTRGASRLAIALALLPAGACATTQKTPTERAFALAKKAGALYEEATSDIASEANPAQAFVDHPKMARTLDMMREARRLQPMSAQLTYDLAELNNAYADAWDKIGGARLDEAQAAQGKGKEAEAERLLAAAQDAGDKARGHYESALRLYRTIPQPQLALPRDKYAWSLLQSAVILMKLNRSLADLEDARTLLQESLDVGHVSPEWRTRFQSLLAELDHEIVNRRMADGGS